MYTASSVVKSIKASKKCSHEHLEYVKCPRDRCNVSPADCSSGNAHTCPHEINVFDENNGLIKIVFFFTISPSDNDGFISKEDSQLQELFNRKIINKSSLKSTTVVYQ